MARAEIELNYWKFRKVLVDLVEPVQREIAEDIADRARASAPVESGAYKDSIRVDSTTAGDLGMHFRRDGNSRRAAVVVATAPHAAAVEAKTGNLKRALGGA